MKNGSVLPSAVPGTAEGKPFLVCSILCWKPLDDTSTLQLKPNSFSLLLIVTVYSLLSPAPVFPFHRASMYGWHALHCARESINGTNPRTGHAQYTMPMNVEIT